MGKSVSSITKWIAERIGEAVRFGALLILILPFLPFVLVLGLLELDILTCDYDEDD